MRVARLRGPIAHVVRPLVGLFGILMGVFAVLAATIHPSFLAGTSPALVISIFYALVRAGSERAVLSDGELSVEGDAICVGGAAVAKRSELRSAVVVPDTRDGTLVRLRRRTSTVDLRVESVDDGRSLLEQLGFDAAHARASFVIRSGDLEAYRRRLRLVLASLAIPILELFATFSLRSSALAVATLVTFLAFIVLALSLALSTEAVVGTDGVLLGRKRFVPLSRIANVELATIPFGLGNEARVVRLLDADGKAIKDIFVDMLKEGPMQEAVHAAVEARAQSLVERIREAKEVAARGAEVDERALARDAREGSAWVFTLRTLLGSAATFRGAEPPSEAALLALVEDATVPGWKRAAAAVAASRSPTARARLRVASEATAEPHLRIALRAAADEDEAEMATALERLEGG